MTLAEDVAARAHANTALTARECGWRGEIIEWPEYTDTYYANVRSIADDTECADRTRLVRDALALL